MESDKNDSSIVARPKEWWLTTRDFFRDTNAEMKKVTWPGKNEVVGTTVVVLVATVIFAVYLWGCDVIFFKAIDFLFTKFGVST
jgi:preprotein translocase subunit SecE